MRFNDKVDPMFASINFTRFTFKGKSEINLQRHDADQHRDVKNIELRIPPKEKQLSLVEKLKTLSDKNEQLMLCLNDQALSMDNLRQSLLQAFLRLT